MLLNQPHIEPPFEIETFLTQNDLRTIDPNIIPLLNRLEKLWEQKTEAISQQMILKIKNEKVKSVEDLTGQYVMLEALATLGLSHSMDTNIHLQSFFHPYFPNQILHSAHIAQPGYREEFLKKGIQNIKALTALLLGNEAANTLHTLWEGNNPIAEIVKSIDILHMGETEQGLLEKQLFVDESPKSLRNTLLRLELVLLDVSKKSD